MWGKQRKVKASKREDEMRNALKKKEYDRKNVPAESHTFRVL